MIIETALFYLTIFLEQEGFVNDNGFVKDIDKVKYEDIVGAVKLGKQMIFILKKVRPAHQEFVMNEAQKVFQKVDKETSFNYLVFVLFVLMRYKEEFRGKAYFIPTTYNDLNNIYDCYSEKDEKQKSMIKDSIKIADEFYEAVVKYE